MTDLELIFTMLGEKVTTEISKKEKPETFLKNKKWPNVEDVLLAKPERIRKKN